jgi:RNA polymerase sigma-70 factor, ECF subfamily
MASDDQHERFMRLLLEHEPEILRSVLVFVPHRADARDIVQETAVALWKHFDEYDPSRSFVNWACGFARMEVRRFLRRAQRRQALTERALEALLASAERVPRFEEEREQHLHDCVERLPVEQRTLIDGYYFQEHAVELLSRQHGRSVEAVYKTLQRVRRALLDCIERKMSEGRA